VKDLDRERQFHLDERAAELEAAGYSPEAARAEAARRFGTPAPIPPRGPERRPTMSLDQFVQDVRFTLRSLRRNAAFAVFATLIAGLGIGATTTVFSVVNALILRPLPFAEPDRLVWMPNRDTGGLSAQTTQVAHMLDLRARTQTMSAVGGYFAFYGVGDQVLTGSGDAERLSGVPVTDNFFDVLGVRPAYGRTFNADETRWQGPRAVLLSDALWRRRFAADPGILNRTLTLNDEPHVVVGIMPAEFDFATVFAPGNRFDLFLPFPLVPETSRWGNTMSMVGRLKPGVPVGAAQAEVRAIADELTRTHTDRNSFVGVVKPLADQVGGRMRTAVWVLTGAVAAVMLIVCANLSNLLLARTASRQREMAIRMAMGAGRQRLVAQMLTEGIVLAGGGAVVGIGLAYLGTLGLAQQNAVSIAMLSSVRLDPTALGFALGLAMLTGILFGLAPALQAPALALHNTLKDSSRGATEGRERRWLRSTLVVAEITFACVLLVGAGLLIRSFMRVLDVSIGFDAARASTIRVDPDARIATPEQTDAYYNDVLTAARAIPGVQAAGITDALPFGRNRTWGVRAQGQTYERGQAPSAYIKVVSDGFFGAMGIPLVAGRDFSRLDASTTEPVAIVNQTLAQRLWPDQTPIGQAMVNLCGQKVTRVIGVAGDMRHLTPEQPSGNELYLPMRQCRQVSSADLVLRSDVPSAQLAATVRVALRPIVPTIAGNEFRGVQQLLDRSVSPRRFLVWLLGGFAAFALLLASFGTYALISYSVNQRTREIGIRMALGASARDVQLGILRQTLILAAIGLALGTAGGWALARGIRGLLFDVTPGDPGTFVAMAAVLMAVAAIAGYLPARRASRTDPLSALRAE
jgi:predicted permease